MYRFFILLISFIFYGCSQVGYLIQQGGHQLDLEWKGRDNEDVLSDPSVSPEHKRKIRLILEAKDFFYKTLKKEITPIYNQTTFLEGDAVSYMVVVSGFNRIEPIMTKFPLYGVFPYLAFFKIDDAKEYAQKWEEDHFTYIRPVYAYSTLNQWIYYDNILSSFFNYDDVSLTEMIFHELTHTVFFVKDEVSFNEHIAEIMGSKMNLLFWRDRGQNITEQVLKGQSQQEEYQKIVQELTKSVREKIKDAQNKQDALLVIKNVFTEKYSNQFKNFCQSFNVKKCMDNPTDWNNAKLAALGTYTSESRDVEEWFHMKNFTPKLLLDYLEKSYTAYREQDRQKSFWKYLQAEK